MRATLVFLALVFGSCHITVVLAEPANSPQAIALQEYKKTLESGDVKQFSAHAAGEAGAILRRLAEPLARAKAASDRLDKALAGKQEIGWQNLFAAGLTPLAGAQLEVVDITKEENAFAARVRYRQAAQEETIGIRLEDGAWRVDLPLELVKQLRLLRDPERLEKRRRQLEQLAEILTTLAGDVESGKCKTKEEVTLRLLELLADSSLFPTTPQPKAGDKTNGPG